MVYQRRQIITESERNRIRGLYEIKPSYDFIISDWLSPDEKYAIFLDELYDIENKVKLGNIFENFELFTKFIKHSFDVATDVSKQIKESVYESIDRLIITESNRNISNLKGVIREVLNEDNIFTKVAGAAKDWAVDTAKGAYTGVSDFISTGIEGAKKLYKGISEGDWNSIIDLIKKGSLYVARKIRDALYNPIGLILDAILIATGVGKGAQFVIWAIVVALDVYELISGDYEKSEQSMIGRLFFFGIDIIGMVFAGAAAKSAEGVIGGLLKKFGSSTEGLAKAVKSSPAFEGFLKSILEGSSKAAGFMERAAQYLKTKSPMMYNFISGIMGGLSKFLNMLVNAIKSIFVGAAKGGSKLLTAPGKIVQKVVKGGAGEVLGSVANVAVPTAAIGTYGQYKQNAASTELVNALKNSEIKPDFSKVKW